jgi:hypothetical protein
MKNLKLTGDEYDALDHIRLNARGAHVNACVGRNTKRLTGLKLIQQPKTGGLQLTDQGKEMLFLRRCVRQLQALDADPQTRLDEDVAHFLNRKSHIAAREDGGIELTARGRESLADIAAQQDQ